MRVNGVYGVLLLVSAVLILAVLHGANYSGEAYWIADPQRNHSATFLFLKEFTAGSTKYSHFTSFVCAPACLCACLYGAVGGTSPSCWRLQSMSCRWQDSGAMSANKNQLRVIESIAGGRSGGRLVIDMCMHKQTCNHKPPSTLCKAEHHSGVWSSDNPFLMR